MATIYVFVGVWAVLALVTVTVVLRRARRIERLTDSEIAEARRLTERGICFDCGGPILGIRQDKRLFDQCDRCSDPG